MARKKKPTIDELIERSWLKPGGELHITADQKPALDKWVREHFKKTADKVASGELTSRKARQGVPKIFIDGAEQEIVGVTKAAKGTGAVAIKPSTKALKSQREEMLKIMTDETKAAKKTGYGRKVRNLLKGQQDHHIFFRTLFEPFYEGLDEADQIKLTQHFLREGTPLGNVTANLAGLDEDLHKELHDWAKSGTDKVKKGAKRVPKGTVTNVGIQVPAGSETWRNIQRNKDGSLKRIMGASEFISETKGRIGGGAKMPNFKHLSLNERLPAVNMYLDLVEEPIRDKTAEIIHRQEARRGGKVRSVDEIKQEYFNFAEDAKARQSLFERGVRPETLDTVREDARAILARGARKLKTAAISSGMGKAEAGLRIAAGDYVGGTVGLAMQTDTFRNKVMKELLKRGGKSAAKLMPGVGVTMGALETAGYASQGRFTQSAIAAFGAAAGEIPGIGDLIQGGTDLLNTGIDIATGNLLPDANLDDEFLENQRRLSRGLRLAN